MGTSGATDAHVQIAKFVSFLDEHPDDELIRREYPDFQCEIYDELSHQQTTWTASTAAMPHLLQIAARLPTDCRCDLWNSCSIMHSDCAGDRTDDEELVSWYQQAIEQARLDTLEFANSNQVDHNAQFELMSAIANFHGETYLYYALREVDYMTFECAHCSEEFEGELDDKAGEFRFGKNNVHRIVPAEDVRNSIVRSGQKMFELIVSACIRGNHQAVLDWLAKRLGSFECPNCKRQSWPIEYGGRTWTP